MSSKRAALIVMVVVSALSLTACSPRAAIVVPPANTGAAPAPAANPAPAPSAAAPVATQVSYVEVADEPTPEYPEGEDPILGTKHWGTRSSDVHGARGHVVTSDLHSNVESFENGLLADQQSTELLDIFSNSNGVHRLIEEYGGDPSFPESRYYVKTIDANEDYAGSSTAWVTATLRADFRSPEGMRGIEMRVYRQKTSEGLLDNTPYIASTQISYLDSTGDLSTDAGYPAAHKPDGLRTIRFKN
jgi:hypothetical protein